MYGRRLAVILTTMSREHYPMLCRMACRANESMVFDAWDSVPDHVGQDHQLGAAHFTSHRSHAYRVPTSGPQHKHGHHVVRECPILWTCPALDAPRSLGTVIHPAHAATAGRARAMPRSVVTPSSAPASGRNGPRVDALGRRGRPQRRVAALSQLERKRVNSHWMWPRRSMSLANSSSFIPLRWLPMSIQRSRSLLRTSRRSGSWDLCRDRSQSAAFSNGSTGAMLVSR